MLGKGPRAGEAEIEAPRHLAGENLEAAAGQLFLRLGVAPRDGAAGGNHVLFLAHQHA